MQTSGGLQYRKTSRLQGFNYSGESFKVTICANAFRPIFGRVTADNRVELSELGRLVDKCWKESPAIRPGLRIDEFIVMPDHFHGIVYIPLSREGASHGKTDSSKLYRAKRSLSSFIGGFKSAVTSAWRKATNDPKAEVWQPRFHEDGIRSLRELENARAYIRENPIRWNQKLEAALEQRAGEADV